VKAGENAKKGEKMEWRKFSESKDFWQSDKTKGEALKLLRF
jgi:hypothetical protein